MEFLNLGIPEILIILVLMFILLGPKEMVLTAHKIGSWVRTFLRSPMWREIWGISQDIRELPKKIVSETGLEETLAEVKQTTQEATDEINKELKDVAEAARVPEAEHMRIDPNAVPAETSKPSFSQASKDYVEKINAKLNVASSSDSAETEQPGAEEEPAVLNVAEEAPAAPKRRGRPKKVTTEAEAAGVEPEAAPEAAEPKRRGRPKKNTTVVDAAAEPESQAAESVKRRGRPKKTVEEQPPAEGEESAAVKQPEAVTAQPEVHMRKVPVLTGAVSVRPVAPKVPAEQKDPEKQEVPETPQVEESAPAAELPVADPPKRRGRPRKDPAVVKVVEDELSTQAQPPAHDNGSAANRTTGGTEEGAGSVSQAAARKPRKPRSPAKRQEVESAPADPSTDVTHGDAE